MHPRLLVCSTIQDGVDPDDFEEGEEEDAAEDNVQYNVVGEDGVVDIMAETVVEPKKAAKRAAAANNSSSGNSGGGGVGGGATPMACASADGSAGAGAGSMAGTGASVGMGMGGSRAWGSGWVQKVRAPDATAAASQPSQPVTIMSMSQLRASAKRRGVDVQVLLQDARAKGVVITDE
jgi:hypothetical protein